MASDISGCREAVSDEAEGVTTLAFFGGGAFAVVVEVGSMSMLGAIVGKGVRLPTNELLRRLSDFLRAPVSRVEELVAR